MISLIYFMIINKSVIQMIRIRRFKNSFKIRICFRKILILRKIASKVMPSQLRKVSCICKDYLIHWRNMMIKMKQMLHGGVVPFR